MSNRALHSYAVVIVMVAVSMSNGGAAAQDHAVAGQGTTCVVSSQADLACMGASVGNGDATGAHPHYVRPKGLGVVGAVALSVFNNFACAIGPGDDIWCWSSDAIRVPFRIQTPTTPPLPLQNATSVSVGASGGLGGADACAVLPHSSVISCWNFAGVSAANLNNVVDVDGNTVQDILQVSVGYGFGCAVRASDHAVLCWGVNDAGQLGRGTVSPNGTLLAAAPVPGVSASMVSAGFNHACAVTLEGSVQCWGADEYGQLGNGQANVATPFPFASPQTVVGLANATMVSAGYEFSCAATADASVKCWGHNGFHKLGATGVARRAAYRSTPVNVNLGPGGKLNYAIVSAGHYHACASGTYGGFKIKSGTSTGLGLFVRCWGDNSYGQLIQ